MDAAELNERMRLATAIIGGGMDKPLGKDGGVSGELSNLGAFGAAIAAAIKHNTEQMEVSGGTVAASIDRQGEGIIELLQRNAEAIDRNTAQMERMEAAILVSGYMQGGSDPRGIAEWGAKQLARIRAEKQAESEGGDRGNGIAGLCSGRSDAFATDRARG